LITDPSAVTSDLDENDKKKADHIAHVSSRCTIGLVIYFQIFTVEVWIIVFESNLASDCHASSGIPHIRAQSSATVA
jgi:hypothetical protein